MCTPSSNHLGREIRMVSNQIARYLGAIPAICQGESLTPMQRMFIGAIYDRTIRDGQDMFQRDLETFFNIRLSTVTGTLQLMEKRGLILRSPVEGDARLKGLQLTEAAVQIHDQIDQGIEHMEHKLRQGLSDEEVEQFHRMLDIISRNLSEPD